MDNSEHAWRDADTLKRLYIDEELSMADVADRLGTHSSTIKTWLDKHDIPTRTVAEGNSNGDINKLRDADYLYTEYIENGKSTYEIAEDLNVAGSIVSKWLNEHDIETRKSYQERSDAKSELLRDKEWLHEKYHEEGLTLKEVAELCGCADDTVKYWIEKHGMETDSKSESFTDGDIGKLQDEEWLSEQYHEKGKSQKEIAEGLGLSQSVVYQYMLKYGLEARERVEYLTDGDLERLHDPEYLEREYWQKRRSTPKIAKDLGVAQQTVSKVLREYGIETRHGTPSGKEHWRSTADLPCGDKYYGPNWIEQRRKARIRDQARCQRCGMTEREHYEENNQALHVHHKTHRSEFIDEDGVLDYKEANKLENLETHCFDCHRKVDPYL